MRGTTEIKRTELGCPGHFIGVRDCVFRRHTQIGERFRVSTVGDYSPRGKRERIGAGQNSYFETMVFNTVPHPSPGNEGCGCRQVESYSEIDSMRYATAGEAQAGHEAMVEKYMALALEGR